ncbi:putative GNAT family N-acyltransferase [Paenibacillus taihuensis]|uniref:Putative GNAT family N-acyltransferase n=1 Tax=Paenibacillus taihuensis TaxID=1156355 RepID=A0A3D9SS37_9BACL|nr:GNAT family N-acetyltransferase [Paenibacillus taihuensis]REE94531.1 putative GNAT family N-acyltransferase [Paenibacillus taihuensis]
MEYLRANTRELLEEAIAVRFEVFVDEQKVPADLERDEYDDTPESCHHFVVKDNGKAVGAGRWKEYEPGVAKLQRIAVLLPYRGHGVGKKLIEVMEQDAKAAGYSAAFLGAQCTAEGFYKKLGYTTESDEPFLDANIPHVNMRKPL